MAADVLEDPRLHAMRRSLMLARVGIVAWAVVVVVAAVLVVLAKPSWVWVLVTAFGALRLLMDLRRMLAAQHALAEEA